MELAVEVVWERIENGIELGLEGFVAPIKTWMPSIDPDLLFALGRSLRRLLFAALLDRRIRPEELREELLSLMAGWVRNVERAVTAEAPGSGLLPTTKR